MKNTFRTCVCIASLLLAGLPAARAAPFYVAGVAGGADANDSSRPCNIVGGFSESYRTFPLDRFVALADGRATAFNPCSPLSGSPLSVASASLQSGQLKVFALTQLDAPRQEAKARAYFGDDVTLFLGSTPLVQLPNGLVGEIRLSIHGSRSTELLDAGANLDVSDLLLGHTIGEQIVEDLQGGETLVVQFDRPFRFFADLTVTAIHGQFGNFGSTGTISISLPPGYSFGSASGVLLTPVPEPGTWAFMLAGLGLAGWAARRARARSRVVRSSAPCALIAKATLVALMPAGALAAAVTTTASPAAPGSNLWTIKYVVTASADDATIEQFTIYFERALYADLAVAASPPAWDSLVVQGDPALPADGFFDALALGAGVVAGASQGGFAVSFLFLGLGAPGRQRFEVVDRVSFDVLEAGSTVISTVPEPGSWLLAGAGLLLLQSRRALRSPSSAVNAGSKE